MSDHIINTILNARQTLKDIFSAPQNELFSYGLSPLAVTMISGKQFDNSFIDNELELAEQHNISIITLEDKQYPKLLKLVQSPPPFLYVRGDISCLSNFCLGVVGSRNCSQFAKDFTYELSYKLAEIGVTIVSGFAYGVDISAHRGAAKKGATACILGNGLLDMYPKQHDKYIDEVLVNGCFVSEFALNTPPHAKLFPQRNRIISGVSNALAVIEANKKSGSLITVRHAKEQGRSVYAVPTSPYATHNACNSLIKHGEAHLLESYLDIVKDFEYDLKLLANETEVEESMPTFENDLERRVYEALVIEPLDINSLCVKLNVSIIELLSVLTTLELTNMIVKADNEKYTVYRF